jgi:hypothetical protein
VKKKRFNEPLKGIPIWATARRLMARELGHPTEAFELVDDQVMKPCFKELTHTVPFGCAQRAGRNAPDAQYLKHIGYGTILQLRSDGSHPNHRMRIGYSFQGQVG